MSRKMTGWWDTSLLIPHYAIRLDMERLVTFTSECDANE